MKTTYKIQRHEPMVLRDDDDLAGPEAEAPESMVRTQIYLTRTEHEFLSVESARRGEAMAAVIRAFIDEKMAVPDDAWTSNSMLEPAPADARWEGHEDGSINHDHYVYGSPKRFEKREGGWVAAPPAP